MHTLSLCFSRAFAACRQFLLANYTTNWFASFGRIPSALFAFDIRVRNTIHLGHKAEGKRACFTTRLQRWFDEARSTLFDLLDYAEFRPGCWQGRVPKLNAGRLSAALHDRLEQTPARLGNSLAQ